MLMLNLPGKLTVSDLTHWEPLGHVNPEWRGKGECGRHLGAGGCGGHVDIPTAGQCWYLFVSFWNSDPKSQLTEHLRHPLRPCILAPRDEVQSCTVKWIKQALLMQIWKKILGILFPFFSVHGCAFHACWFFFLSLENPVLKIVSFHCACMLVPFKLETS